MNIEIFLAVFLGLVAYRVVSPVIDFLNPFSSLTRPKDIGAHARELSGRAQGHASDSASPG